MATRKKATAKQQRKISKVMREFRSGSLKSGGRTRVKSRKQAIAIALSSAGLSRKRKKK